MNFNEFLLQYVDVNRMVDGTSDDIKKVMSEAKRAAQRGGGRKSKQSAMVNTKTRANLHT